MKALLINSVCGIRSTGRICTDIAKSLELQEYEVKIGYGREVVPKEFQKYAVKIGNDFDIYSSAIHTRLTDRHGFLNRKATKKFLEWADEFNPDILWLHNLHGYYINIEMLFNWIKSKENMKVKWTLHDCWAFTGHCSHFSVANCQQWKNGCKNCMQMRSYPQSILVDACRKNYVDKKRIFTNVRNMTLITPSQWLADLTKESFLRDYPVEVQYNKINTDVFKPRESNFKEKNGIAGKKMILGVASAWCDKKGFKDFQQLIAMLDDKYAIVLVGLDEKNIKELEKNFKYLKYKKVVKESVNIYNFLSKSEKKESIKEKDSDYIVGKYEDGVVIKQGIENLFSEIVKNTKLGKGIATLVCISKTNNMSELAEIYTAADVFANPTREDTYPTVNLEARACGTYVITYDTGGCEETIKNDYR